MFSFIIFNLTRKQTNHLHIRKHVKLRRIMEVQRIFIVDLVFKFNFQFYHQIRFHFTCRCKISGFQKVNMWIEWLVIVHKYQLVHFFCLKTFPKCNQNANNRKNALCLYLVGQDAKYMSCQYNKGWKLVLFFMPPK